MTRTGTLTTLASFIDFQNGAEPVGGLIQSRDGNLYGTTKVGGANGGGSAFKITSSGTLTALYNFCSARGCPDGSILEAPVIQTANGDFFGTTDTGGDSSCQDGFGCGTIFKMTQQGVVSTRRKFEDTDGNDPSGGLLQATSGLLYGATYSGGVSGEGTIFSLDAGFSPFVRTVPAQRKVGQRVMVLGTNLTGATSVTFNGTAATFTVVSPSLITTTVPTGATIGPVQVVTPGGTLSSNLPFRVLP
jgi:uncharacterized repeat protein (TIGR03803 family)